MNTKTVKYKNGDTFEIAPFSKRLQAGAATELTSKRNMTFTLQAAPLDATLELNYIQAKRVAVSCTKKGAQSPIERSELDAMLDKYDALQDWVIAEGVKFQKEIDDEFAAEAKN